MDYEDLVGDLNAKGVGWTGLGPAQATFAGDPRDIHGVMANYLRDAVRRGLISEDEVPAALSFRRRGAK